MLDIRKISLNLDGYNFVTNKSENDKIMTLEELLELTQNLYADMTHYEEKIEELEGEVEELKEQIENIEDDIKDNYNKKSPYEVYGISERDFI